MTEVRRADDGFWHIARDDRGVYIRIGVESRDGIVIPVRVARELGLAIREVSGE